MPRPLAALCLAAGLAAVAGCGDREAPDAGETDPAAARAEAATDPTAADPAPASTPPGVPTVGHPADPSTWPTYGGDPGQARYSPLDGIHAGNVGALEPAWIYRTGMEGIFESTPLVVDEALYVTTPAAAGEQRVVRLDARTGERVWEARLPVGQARPHPAAVNRGAAWLDGRLFVGTADARLVALDAATGEQVWERRIGDPAAGHQLKHAPVAWDGLVVAGAEASPYGVRGFVRAYDADTGEPRWTWHAIPSPEEGGWWGEWTEEAPGTGIPLERDIAAERADSARYADAWRSGGAVVWMTPTLDVERELVFVGTSNPAPELTGFTRPGDNRWSVSVCALRFRTGEQVWCYQYIPHDLWGLDAASPPFLFEMEPDRAAGGNADRAAGGSFDGTAVPAVGHFAKLGVFFAWHRETGELLTVSENYVPHSNPLARPTEAGVTVAPGLYGGTEWSPAAFHPGTGWVYAANLHWPSRYRVIRTPEGARRITHDLVPGERWGNVVALDPASGRVEWEARTPLPMVGGVLVTAGDLVFAGRLDGGLGAWHARTGEELWRGEADHGCASAPVTWELEGRQHVAVSCGGHFLGGSGRGDALHVFALPADG